MGRGPNEVTGNHGAQFAKPRPRLAAIDPISVNPQSEVRKRAKKSSSSGLAMLEAFMALSGPEFDTPRRPRQFDVDPPGGR